MDMTKHQHNFHILEYADLCPQTGQLLSTNPPLRSRSDGVRNVDETVLDREDAGEMLPQGRHTITLGGMVPGSEKMYARFPGLMHRLLRRLARDVGVETKLRGIQDCTLSSFKS